MKTLRNALVFALAATLAACGPSKAELRSRLMQVEAEMAYLSSLAQSYRDQMTAADFAAFLGGFAAGYGATTADGALALQGAGVVFDADTQSRAAQMNLGQIQARFNELDTERTVLISRLK